VILAPSLEVYIHASILLFLLLAKVAPSLEVYIHASILLLLLLAKVTKKYHELKMCFFPLFQMVPRSTEYFLSG